MNGYLKIDLKEHQNYEISRIIINNFKNLNNNLTNWIRDISNVKVGYIEKTKTQIPNP